MNFRMHPWKNIWIPGRNSEKKTSENACERFSKRMLGEFFGGIPKGIFGRNSEESYEPSVQYFLKQFFENFLLGFFKKYFQNWKNSFLPKFSTKLFSNSLRKSKLLKQFLIFSKISHRDYLGNSFGEFFKDFFWKPSMNFIQNLSRNPIKNLLWVSFEILTGIVTYSFSKLIQINSAMDSIRNLSRDRL